MTPPTPDNIIVYYDIKEILQRIESKLDAKADMAVVETLASRVDAQGQRHTSLDGRVAMLEDRALQRDNQIRRRDWAIGLLVACAAIFVPYILGGGHFS